MFCCSIDLLFFTFHKERRLLTSFSGDPRMFFVQGIQAVWMHGVNKFISVHFPKLYQSKRYSSFWHHIWIFIHIRIVCSVIFVFSFSKFFFSMTVESFLWEPGGKHLYTSDFLNISFLYNIPFLSHNLFSSFPNFIC